MAITFPTVFQSTIATDPAATAAGYLTPSRYNQGCSVAGLSSTAGALLYSSDATTLAQDANLKWEAGVTAGKGLTRAAGTATTDVSADTLTRTNNGASVGQTAPWVSWDFTDTSSHASSLAFRIRGGASATTNLFSIDKSGAGVFGSSGAGRWKATIGNLRYLNGLNDALTIFETNDSTGDCNFYQSASFTEMSAPTGTANKARIFAQDNGGGKTQLMVIFGSGVAQQIAIEA